MTDQVGQGFGIRPGYPGAFGGGIAGHYDQDLGPITFAGFAAYMAHRVASIGKPSRVLETAAGSGIVTRLLRDALTAPAHIIATDISDGMLDIARSKFRADENVAFQVADAMALPFADGAFDTMVCQFGVMFYPDKENGYREAHRVLKPGGRYLFSVWDSLRRNPYGRLVDNVIRRLCPTDPPCFFAAPFAYHQIDPIKDSLLGAGFGEIIVSIVQHHQPVMDFSAFARGLVFGSPALYEISRRGAPAASEIQEAVAAAMRQEFGSEPSAVRMQAIFFVACRDAQGTRT